MRYEDERYVRLYTRDTATWIAIGFEGRHILMSLLRKVDRAGVLDVLKGEEVEILSALIMAPLEVVKVGLERMVARGVVVIADGQIRLPRFLEAQECRTSDKERQRKSRELAAVGHTPSHAVTASHTPSHSVTPSCAVPSHAVPKEASVAKKPATPTPQLGLLTIALVADYEAMRPGEKYPHSGAADAQAVKRLLKLATEDKIRERWRNGLRATGWASCSTFAQLAHKWADLAAPKTASKGPVDAGTQSHTQTGWVTDF